MRCRTHVALVVISILVAACLPPGTHTFATVSTGPRPFGVVLTDETGTVSAITARLVPPAEAGTFVPPTRVENTSEQSIAVWWVDGGCHRDIEFVVERPTSSIVIAYDIGPPCSESIGITRELHLTFIEPVAAEDVTTEVRQLR